MIGNLTYLKDQNNYGMVLQCYAIQRYVKKAFNKDVFTLDCHPKKQSVSLSDGRFLHAFERDCLNTMRPDASGYDSLMNCEKVILGGDQVLNKRWNGYILPYIYRRSVKERNVFAYGAGLGPDHVVESDVVSDLAPHMIAYGTREDCNLSNYVKVIDPVFLSMDELKDIAIVGREDFSCINYFYKADVPRIRRYLSVSAGESESIINESMEDHGLDPREFLGLFKVAKRIKTDSFHGFVFAIIFGTPEIEIMHPGDHRIRNLVNMLNVKFEGQSISNRDEVFENIGKWVEKSKKFIEYCMEAKPMDYCGFSMSPKTRCKSSSGGIAAELAFRTIRMGGVVYGGAFTDGFRRVETVRVESEEDYLRKLSKSKYSFCSLPDLAKVKEDVDSGRQVCFIGSPCQIASVREFFGKTPDNLLLVDFRCHGFSDSKFLRDFIDDVESRHGEISRVDFRPDHKCGDVVFYPRKWHGNVGIKKSAKQFLDRAGLLPMCLSCQYAHGFVSYADITVGDFWRNRGDRLGIGSQFDPEKGCNIVSVNTEKGRSAFDGIKEAIVYKELFTTSSEKIEAVYDRIQLETLSGDER